MTKEHRAAEFDADWQSFYEEALNHFDGYLYPETDGIKPIKRDRERLKKLFKLLQKGY